MRLPDPERSRAILLGVSRYADNDIEDLPSVENNLEALQEVLTNVRYGGFAAERCSVCRQPRLADNPVQQVAGQGRLAEDVFLVYYCGHAYRSMDHRLLLTTVDTSAEELKYTTIKIDDLREAIAESAAAVRVLILDCCFSGSAIPRALGPAEDALVDAAALEGAYILTSSAANRASNAPADAPLTTFTAALITVLRDGIADGPEVIALDQLHRHLDWVLRSTRDPAPKQSNSGSAKDLALVRNRAWRPDAPAGDGEPDYLRHYREITDTSADLDARIMALEAVARRAAANPVYRQALHIVVGNADLPLLLRITAVCRLERVAEPGSAEAAVAALTERDPRAVLDDIADILYLPRQDDDWLARLGRDWDLPSERPVRLTDDALWGLLTAMVLTAVGLPVQRRVAAATELAGLGEPELARSVLEGMLRYRDLDAADRAAIHSALADPTSTAGPGTAGPDSDATRDVGSSL